MDEDSESKQKSNRGGPRFKTRPDDARGAPPGKFGQPEYVPNDHDREIIEAFAMILTNPHLAAKIGISKETLMKHYQVEMDEARSRAAGSIGSKVVQQALAGHFPSQSLFMRTRGGWVQQAEISGPGGGPIPIEEKQRWAEFLSQLPEEDYLHVRDLWERFNGRSRPAIAAGDAVGRRDIPDGGSAPRPSED